MRYLSFFLFLALLPSCTITKRLHNPGWHVEWRNNHPVEVNQSIQKNSLLAEQEKTTEVTSSNSQYAIADPTQKSFESNPLNEKETAGESIRTDEVLPSENSEYSGASEKIIHPALSEYPNRLMDDELSVDERDLNPYIRQGVMTMLISLLCLALMLLGFSNLFTLYCWAAVTVLGAVTIRKAYKGLKEMKAQPEVWKGKRLAKFLLIFGIIEVFLMIDYMVVAFFLFLSGWLLDLIDLTFAIDGFL